VEVKCHLQQLPASEGSRRPVQAAFPHLRDRQPQRAHLDLLTGTPVLGAVPGGGGGGDGRCGAGEYVGVRGETCAPRASRIA